MMAIITYPTIYQSEDIVINSLLHTHRDPRAELNRCCKGILCSATSLGNPTPCVILMGHLTRCVLW